MQISNLLEGDNIVLIFLIIASIIFLIYVAGQKKNRNLIAN